MNVLDRFLRYISFDTQSSPDSETSPSSTKQLVLGKALLQEMQEIGLQDTRMDACGNVFGTIPAAPGVDAPVIGFLSHMDTSPDAGGKDVHPRIVEHYDGGRVELGAGAVLSPDQFPFLADLTGESLIVTDGTTLLGADDKAGIAEIMTMADSLLHSNRPHGEIHISYTTDEEVGRGTEGFDVKAFGCRWAYTVDGGPLGELEFENFNAASARIRIRGEGVHPGSAKNIMKNAIRIGMELEQMLPAAEKPEYTENREGFIHLAGMQGTVTGAELGYIIRDHDRSRFEQKKKLVSAACDFLNLKYGEGTVSADIRDSYYNMKEIVDRYPILLEKAEQAFLSQKVEPVVVPIRGGTDGAMLSYQGLPCPNLSTGGYNFHGIYELIPVRSLKTMPLVLEELACSFVGADSQGEQK